MSSTLLVISIHLTCALRTLLGRVRAGRTSERGQATAEYALVLLGAAAVAVLVVGWAARTGKIGDLLNSVFDQLLGKVR
ncbi:MAG TPA: DUF4244 domain-containing protein [Acidimicrobiales bacterium]|nr:DUF4244 domain-containing protein [Acidimicrobiales bacterium]